MSIAQLLACCAGAFLLGAALILALILAVSARNSEDQTEGCLSKFFLVAGLIIAGLFFLMALHIG